MLYYELVMTTKSYMRQVMEIKPQWLLEGMSNAPSLRPLVVDGYDWNADLFLVL